MLILLLAGGAGFTRAAEPVAAPAPAATSARPMRMLAESDIVAMLTGALQRNYIRDKGQLELTFTQPWTPVAVPDEPLTVNLLELPTMGVTSSFIVRFQLCAAHTNIGTWQAAIQAHVWRDVWVARTTLRRGEPVNGADIVRERQDVLNLRDALAEFAPDDASLELAEPVPAGVPLLARMIKPRTVIHRGQLTNAVLQDGALSISTKVEALEDGAPGQIIRVRNPVSRRDLSGRVLDSQTLLISL